MPSSLAVDLRSISLEIVVGYMYVERGGPSAVLRMDDASNLLWGPDAFVTLAGTDLFLLSFNMSVL